MSRELVIDIVHSDKNVTVVHATLYGQGPPVVGHGVSRRVKQDHYDKTTGENLALARAFKSLGGHLERRTLGLNKHAEEARELRVAGRERRIVAGELARTIAEATTHEVEVVKTNKKPRKATKKTTKKVTP